MRHFTNAINGCAAVTWVLVLAIGTAAADNATAVGGKALNGLRLYLDFSATETGQTLQQHCTLILENVGESDLNVWLGFSMANGKSYHPASVRLLARSKGGETRTLVYPSLAVAGRVDPFVLPMLAGSSYTLRLPFDKYVDSKTGERLDLTSKDYQISAELVGEAVSKTNQDMQGLALMKFWEGKVRSNEVPFPSAEKAAP